MEYHDKRAVEREGKHLYARKPAGLLRSFHSLIKAKVSFGARGSDLALIKKFAQRRGIWFRALNRVERGILDLTTQYVQYIRSAKLAKVLTAIIEKLKTASESVVDRMVRIVGLSLAQKISDISFGWGNHSAISWAFDTDFARFLAVGHMNTR